MAFCFKTRTQAVQTILDQIPRVLELFCYFCLATVLPYSHNSLKMFKRGQDLLPLSSLALEVKKRRLGGRRRVISRLKDQCKEKQKELK